MENDILTVTVRNKVPSVSFGEYLVSENTGYRIRFDFDREWESHYVKIAHFDMGGWQYEKQFAGSTVDVPLLPSDITELKLGVIAGDLTTTSAVTIPVYDSILSGAQPTSTEDAAEMARVRAEAERVAAERDRVAAENARAIAEQQRVNAENARIAAETARASAERSRAASETTRISNESVRISTENARQSAETARQNAEASRAAAEVLRRSEETGRILNEQNRISAEELRVSAENTRIINETARIGAEQNRASAENARSSAETARAAAETARVAAENGRAAAEAARAAAENERQALMDGFLDAVNNSISANDIFNVPYLIDTYGTKAAFRMFAEANASLSGLTKTALRFFAAASAADSGIYTSQFNKYSSNAASYGTKKDKNEDLVCVPATNSTAGRDDYSDLPLFACFDCNYTIDADTLEPVIHAIKDVYGSFTSSPTSSFVGVMQMTGWYKRTLEETTKTVHYAASKIDMDFKPLPEAVRASNNSVRPFVIHSKYPAGYNSAGKLSSISGVHPVYIRPGSAANANSSHDAQIAKWAEWGSQYSGMSICDAAFLQLMLELKYAVLGSSKVMKGCRDFDAAEAAAVSETGVKRIILPSETAGKFPVGCSVSVGTGSNRNSAASSSIADASKVIRIDDVMVDGTAYKALVLDSAESFNVEAGTTLIVSQPWMTGSTDAVRGNDGSPYNNLSGVEPFKLQGIEVMNGVQEVAADVMVTVASYSNSYYVNRRAADIRNASTGNSPSCIATLERVASGWRFIKEVNWGSNDQESYMFPAVLGASSTTGYCAPVHHLVASVQNENIYEYILFGALNSASNAGLASLEITNLTNYGSLVTGCRACGTAANRGVYNTGNTI